MERPLTSQATFRVSLYTIPPFCLPGMEITTHLIGLTPGHGRSRHLAGYPLPYKIVGTAYITSHDRVSFPGSVSYLNTDRLGFIAAALTSVAK